MTWWILHWKVGTRTSSKPMNFTKWCKKRVSVRSEENEVSLLAARWIRFSSGWFYTGDFCTGVCIHVTDHEPIADYSLAARLFRVHLSEAGEQGLVARLCGLQNVIVDKRNYNIVKQREWEWNWRELALHTVIPVAAPEWESCCLGVRMEMYSIAPQFVFVRWSGFSFTHFLNT